MSTGTHDRWADAAGAYVLRALSDDERADFESHLDECAICRREVDELGVAAEALPASVPQLAAPPELKARIMAVVEQEAALLSAAGEGPVRERPAARGERGRWWRRLGGGLMLRPGFAAVAVAGLLAVGALGGALVAGGDGDGGGTTTVQAQVDALTAPGARVRLEIHDGRATLVARGLPAPPTGRIYQVWRKQPGRAPAPTDALFTVDRNGSASVAVPGTTNGLEAVLVTDEPKRGSEVPSRQPRIIARPA